MSDPLRQELSLEQDRLSGLVIATQNFIGGVAQRGYQALSTLPATESAILLPGPDGPNRFFQGRNIVRTATLPDGPVALAEDGFTVIGTSTETHRRQHYIGGRPLLKLPVQNRLVRVDLRHPRQSVSPLPSTVSISTRGYATFNLWTDRTLPRALESDLAAGYTSPEDLRDNYAQAFTEALAVTGLVAACLQRVHGIESDTGGFGGLVSAWQQASPAAQQALGADMMAFLPEGGTGPQ